MLINDRFEIKEELGRGGLGVVYLAIDLHNNGQRVVIKAVLDRLKADEQTWVERHFRNEIKALARIDHPGVVKLIDFGHFPDGKPFLAMEYVEGFTLSSELLPNKGLGDFQRVARLIRETCQAISAAHDERVYHRDLKPDNIMLYKSLQDEEEEEHVKIIDFGIATVKDRFDEKTRATWVAGHVRYMAPEQIQGIPNRLSDIYSLGVIAYEMLTGSVPFNPDQANPVAAMKQMHELQRAGVKVKPKDLRPSLPDEAQNIILKALDFTPENRYQRADSFGDDLARALVSMAGPEAISTISGKAEGTLDMAYVLFTDIVGYSLLPMDYQIKFLNQLKEVVSSTEAYRKAKASNRLISLPTGDGMALVFFDDLLAAVQCAVEVAQGLQQYPHIPLRMGVNHGPVYHVADINGNKNVAGDGINIAQRVMDFGDAGHILISSNVEGVLSKLSEWQFFLYDLGTHPVKHGVRVHLFNLHTEKAGNPNLPKKLSSSEANPDSPEKNRPPVQEAGQKPDGRHPQSIESGDAINPAKQVRPRIYLLASIALAISLLAVIGWQYFGTRGEPPKNENINSNKERQLSYWGELQPYRNQKPIGKPTKLTGGVSGETYFRKGDGIRFFLISSDDGYLYLINEEASQDSIPPQYNILFPSPDGNKGSSQIMAAHEIATSECNFDAKIGTEKVWIVWSVNPIAALEDAISKWANTVDEGKIKDSDKTDFLRKLLEQSGGTKPQVTRDEVKERIDLRGRGDVLIYPLKLTHVK